MHLTILCLTFLLAPKLQAQFRVENPHHLDFPQERAELIINSARQVVAEEFHVQDAREVEFPLTLVLGSTDEYYDENEDTKTYAVHLRSWDEVKFAVSVVRLSVHRLITKDRRDKMLARVLNRVNRVSPVDVSHLPGKPDSAGNSSAK
jgi:hypothetical protein